mgnify:CR=1 FL=1
MQKQEYKKMYKLEDYHFWFLAKRYFIDSFLADDKNQIKEILDVGAGTGGLSLFLKKYGRVYAIEKNPLAISLAKKRGLNVKRADADNLPFKKSVFDLVTVFDVLYHRAIDDEKKVVKEIARVLKPGGFLLITDSAFEFLRSSHDTALGGKRRYTIKSLGRIIISGKFKIIRASYIFFSIFPLTIVRRLLLKGRGSDVRKVPWFLNQVLLLILRLEAFLLRYVNFPFGSSLIVLAKKR